MERLGEFLRKGREHAGMSLEDLAASTRIRLQNLEALESEDLDALPNELYVRGFVKLFCREVGLVPEEGLLRFETLKQRAVPDDAITWEEERSIVEPGALERALGDPDRLVRQARFALKWGGITVGGALAVFLVTLAIRAVDLGARDVDAGKLAGGLEAELESSAPAQEQEPALELELAQEPAKEPGPSAAPLSDAAEDDGEASSGLSAGAKASREASRKDASAPAIPRTGGPRKNTTVEKVALQMPELAAVEVPDTQTLRARYEPEIEPVVTKTAPAPVAAAEVTETAPEAAANGTDAAEPREGASETLAAVASPSPGRRDADGAPPPTDSKLEINSTPTVSKAEPLPDHREFLGAAVPAGEPLVLQVEALRHVDVTIFLDGSGQPREKTLAPGETKRWKARKLFLVSATDAGAIRLHLQGESLGVPGPDFVPLKLAVVRPRSR